MNTDEKRANGDDTNKGNLAPKAPPATRGGASGDPGTDPKRAGSNGLAVFG